jgi:3-oxoacyl-[acyl-carrier protein] reductase
MHAVVPGMAERGWGRVVNIATVAAKSPGEIRILSGTTRAALVNYTVAVSKKVANRNVTINNLLPGMFHTAFTHDQFTERAAQNGTTYDEEVAKFCVEWRIVAERFGQSEELAAFVGVFCSEMAGYTTGQSLVIDGGATTMTF